MNEEEEEKLRELLEDKGFVVNGSGNITGYEGEPSSATPRREIPKPAETPPLKPTPKLDPKIEALIDAEIKRQTEGKPKKKRKLPMPGSPAWKFQEELAERR